MNRVENAEDDLLALLRQVGHVVARDDLEQVEHHLRHLRVGQPVLLLQAHEHLEGDVECVRQALIVVDPKDAEGQVAAGKDVPQDAEGDPDVLYALLVVAVFTRHFRGIRKREEAVA